MKKVLMFATLVSAVLAGCSKSEDLPVIKTGEKNELGVSATINSAVQTRAMVDGFVATNQIGVFVTGSLYTPKLALYTFDGTSTWAPPATLTDKIYLSNETATVYGFYPSSATITGGTLANDGTNKVNIIVPAVQNIDGSTGINDYMYATAPFNVSAYPLATASNATNKEKVDLVFHHALSKLSFIINKAVSYTGSGKLTKLALSNTGSTSPRFQAAALTMGVADGVIAGAPTVDELTVQGTAVNINAYNATPLTTVVTKTLIAPLGSTADITLKLTIDGKEMPVVLPFAAPADKWEAGKNYIYTITVKGTELLVNSVSILAWNDVPTTGVDVQ